MVLRSIESAIQFVADQPYGAEKTNDPRVRVKLVLRYRYRSFYRVREETIEIVHIRHTSRRPWIGQ
jgi:toxin ParE1/3/4